jgi:hypothetical protein
MIPKTTTCKTWGTCWHFVFEPFTDIDCDVYAGCGNDRDFIVRSDPKTLQTLESRPVTADDVAYQDYLTQQLF